MSGAQEKAMIFIDSANFYHNLDGIGCSLYDVDFNKLAAQLLVANRSLVKIHYYAAPVNQAAVPQIYKAQQRFWASLKNQGVEIVLGYMQARRFSCSNCGHTQVGVICPDCGRHFGKVEEKGVDVNIAAEMVYFAALGSFDIAYLISSDGDLEGACEKVRLLGRKVIYVCIPPTESAALKRACNYTTKKDRAFFEECRNTD